MSAQLEKEAAAMAGFVHGFRRQMFHSVPPIPAEVDLKGKTALVTGSNIGLGLECARHFLSLQPALLIMAVRSLSKSEAAAKGLRAEFPDARIKVWELDMASFRSVRAFVERCARDIPQDQSGNRRLHAAVLNAGLGAFEFARVGEGRGRETMLQVNYLATALLAILLLPIMKPSPSPSAQSKSASEPGRLTLVGSDSALTATLTDPGKDVGILDYLDRDRPEGARFDGFAQYGDSKLLLTMFVAKLAAEFVSADDVVVNVTNPGPTWGTEIISKNGPLAARLFTGVLFSVLGRSPRDAARTYVHSNQILGKESHGSYTEWLIRAWPPIMYTEEGRRLGDRLWGETMAELSSAKVEETLQEMKRIP
ncbi:Short-chain dehydrogenase/reductase tropG [Apiospora arundinis]|uniref:Short-chain dehydrogenase/reductase tropG n=1 Tax=Apiospora arundinis TaxID=335852 RepID=A0ABR2I142_9PEZI